MTGMRKLSILMYHQVGDFNNIKTLKANYCHHRSFSRQMAMLKITGQTVIPMSKAVEFLKGEGDYPDRCVAITFDDGYENFYQYAYPVLMKYGFSAMVYVVSGEFSGSSGWLTEDNHKPSPLMSTQQILEIHRNGIEIGSHSVTHPRLANIDLEDCRIELQQSKDALEQLLGCEVDHVCYPYGSCSKDVLQIASEVGYHVGTTTVKGVASAGHDALALPRKAVSVNDTTFKVWKNIFRKAGAPSGSIVLQSIFSAK